jgi:GAF domain-containing protein
MLSNVNPVDVLHRISDLICHSRTSDRLTQQIVDTIESTIGFEYGAVLLIDPATRRLEPLALSRQGKGEEFLEEDRAFVFSRTLTSEAGITGFVARSGESVRLGDVREDPRYLPLRDDIRSELCVPIQIGGRILGVLNTETTRADAYTATDEKLLEIVAVQIATAIERSRLEKEGLLRDERAGFDRALAEVLPVCSYCKKVRVAGNDWQRFERFVADRLKLTVSHGACPGCLQRVRSRSRTDEPELQ